MPPPPLLTRPKEADKRQVILDLSYPSGQFLNDLVSKDLFDGYKFYLKSPSIDHIVESTLNVDNDPWLFKIEHSAIFGLTLWMLLS